MDLCDTGCNCYRRGISGTMDTYLLKRNGSAHDRQHKTGGWKSGVEADSIPDCCSVHIVRQQASGLVPQLWCEQEIPGIGLAWSIVLF